MEALWETASGVSITVFFVLCVWSFILTGWGVAQFLRRRRDVAPTLATWVVPVCALVLLVGEVTHAPLRLLFWTHQKALEKALARPPVEREFTSHQSQIGLFRPLQISKSGKATQFILWENQDLLSGAAVGFAYCPGDAGCSRANFEDFYSDYERSPKTIQLSENWMAVSTYGSDF